MCDKCNCKKVFTWLAHGDNAWNMLSPEGEYIARVERYSDLSYKWGDRYFVSLEAAKAVIEKSFAPVKTHTDAILSDIIREVSAYHVIAARREVTGINAVMTVKRISHHLNRPRD